MGVNPEVPDRILDYVTLVGPTTYSLTYLLAYLVVRL